MENNKQAMDLLKSKRFLTMLFTTVVVFLNSFLKDQTGFSIPADTANLLIQAAIALILGYSVQDALKAWKGKGGSDLIEIIREVVTEIIQEAYGSRPDNLTPPKP